MDRLYETIEQVKSRIPEKSDVIFGMEATGIYYLPLYTTLKRDGHMVKLYNPYTNQRLSENEHPQDQDRPNDAAIIADMLRYSEPPLANEIKDLNLYQLRELVRVRHRIID